MARTDKLAEAHERLTRAVEEIVSGEDWQQMLAVAARFHRYSAANVMLIRAQRPDATRVAGYRTWQSLDRQVRKGETGIAILAPCVYRARPVDDSDEERSPELARVLRGFTVVYVFDQFQTEGQPIPEVSPTLLEGDDPAALWERLAAQVHAAGFTLSRGDCAPANGRTDFAARTVVIGAALAPAQAAKTLAHEVGHIVMGHGGTEYALGCRGRAEVEAESVAFLVCATAGLPTDGYSFPYVAGWAENSEVVRATAEVVIGCARRILDAAGLLETEAAA